MNMSLRDALADLYSRFDADQHRERYAAAADLIANEEKRRVRQVGDQAPEFALTDPDLGNVTSSEGLLRGPLIVNFYRGLWCSYCQQDLLGLEQIMPDIRKANASVVVITHGLETTVRQHLRQTTNFGFPIVDDVNGDVAEQFGIRWPAEDANRIESALGTDLVSFRGTSPWILPMQARYVIGQDGIIVFANVAIDYDQRSEPASILPVLAELGFADKSRGEQRYAEDQ
jgi:peroxiredoxin